MRFKTRLRWKNDKLSDFELGQECIEKCESGFESCYLKCGSDFDCVMDCNRSFAKCSDSCPCHTDCINGCNDCDNPICFCTGYTDENLDSCISKNSLTLGLFSVSFSVWISFNPIK